MFTPRYVVNKAEGVGGDPIPTDEPVLVIRAQDDLAQAMLDYYIRVYVGRPDFSTDVMQRLASHKKALIEWQAANPDKVKVAD